MDKKIILASASPRRKELLENIGLDFFVIPSTIEEKIEKIQDVENVALEKALDVAQKIDFPAIIIGSDTIVTINNKILGKPQTRGDAFNMLKLLSNKTHSVISAIAVYDTETEKTVKTSVKSDVTFRKLDDEEIQNYVNTGDPMDKAGAYAIQGKAAIFVKSINGCYSNIVGISQYKVAEILKDFGIRVL
ncbi:MAG: septum formation protein Maf [Candidatus Melainabacteria bacterium GWF2_37_15]|nr:MAG: septum formation protein Maf [Candidatus Melainabacteria bacterium GWF2_37_15]